MPHAHEMDVDILNRLSGRFMAIPFVIMGTLILYAITLLKFFYLSSFIPLLRLQSSTQPNKFTIKLLALGIFEYLAMFD